MREIRRIRRRKESMSFCMNDFYLKWNGENGRGSTNWDMKRHWLTVCLVWHKTAHTAFIRPSTSIFFHMISSIRRRKGGGAISKQRLQQQQNYWPLLFLSLFSSKKTEENDSIQRKEPKLWKGKGKKDLK